MIFILEHRIQPADYPQFVIRAKDEQEARELAATQSYGNDKRTWRNKKATSCKAIFDGPSCVILETWVDA